MIKPSKGHNNRQTHNFYLYDSIDKYLRDFIPDIKGKVYDLGCGNMHYRGFIEILNAQYVGVDWNQSLHSIVLPDVICDLNGKLPIATNAADTVMCISVLEHLKNPEAFLKEVRRIVKSEGKVFFQVPFMWHVHEAPHDFRRFTKYALNNMFVEAGFDDVLIVEQSGLGLTIALKLNYFLLSLLRGPRYLRKVLRILLSPIFIINQSIGAFLDSFIHRPYETVGYCVRAS